MQEKKREIITPPELLEERDSYLIIEKPSGWVVNSSSTTGKQHVIQEWLKKNFSYPISERDECRSGIVHRLDKETSGLLIVAKNTESFDYLQRQFKERKVKKEYVALAHGKFNDRRGQITVDVGRLPWNRKRFGVIVDGRWSSTDYEIEKEYGYQENIYSLVRLKPATGRTHQIRIHLKYIGHPIVGDEFYAGRKTARKDRLWCSRLFLHACTISFIDPDSKKKVEYSSNLPPDLKKVLELIS